MTKKCTSRKIHQQDKEGFEFFKADVLMIMLLEWIVMLREKCQKCAIRAAILEQSKWI